MKNLRVNVLRTIFYKIFAKILVKYLTMNLSTLKINVEDLVKKPCADFNKTIDQLQDELKSKDHIINKILTTIGHLTSSKLRSKDNIIHKLINQSNCEENTNRISMNQSSNEITSDNTQGINDSDKNNSINAIKEQVATIKENSTSNLIKYKILNLIIKEVNEKSKNQISKAKPEKSHISKP